MLPPLRRPCQPSIVCHIDSFEKLIYIINMEQGFFRLVFSNRMMIVRSILTLAYYAMIFYVLWLLFFYKVSAEYRDILNIIVGAVIASFSKVTDFWFKSHSESGEGDSKT